MLPQVRRPFKTCLNMKRLIFNVSIFAILLIGLSVTSCGGVDTSDPRSVADAAMECYINDDYEGMIILADPEDTHVVKQLETMAQLFRENPDAKPASTNRRYEFDSIDENGGSATAVYKYSFTDKNGNDETWDKTVTLANKDGRWYCSQVR